MVQHHPPKKFCAFGFMHNPPGHTVYQTTEVQTLHGLPGHRKSAPAGHTGLKHVVQACDEHCKRQKISPLREMMLGLNMASGATDPAIIISLRTFTI